MNQLKVKPFPGVQKIAPEHIEKRAMEDELRAAQFALDVQLHDLRTEFLHREAKLRNEYLSRVAGITGEAARHLQFPNSTNLAKSAAS